MTEQNPLSLEEMLKLARKVNFWEKVEDKRSYERYKGHVGNLSLEVATIYCSAHSIMVGTREVGYEDSKVGGQIKVYGGGLLDGEYGPKPEFCLGIIIDDKVKEIVGIAKRAYSERIKKDETQLLKEARIILSE